MDHGFQGREGQEMPIMPDLFVEQISQRYIQLYEQVTGQTFVPDTDPEPADRIERAITTFLADRNQPAT